MGVCKSNLRNSSNLEVIITNHVVESENENTKQTNYIKEVSINRCSKEYFEKQQNDNVEQKEQSLTKTEIEGNSKRLRLEMLKQLQDIGTEPKNGSYETTQRGSKIREYEQKWMRIQQKWRELENKYLECSDSLKEERDQREIEEYQQDSVVNSSQQLSDLIMRKRAQSEMKSILKSSGSPKSGKQVSFKVGCKDKGGKNKGQKRKKSPFSQLAVNRSSEY